MRAQAVGEAIGLAIAGVLVLIFLVPLATLFGGIVGSIVGFFFGTTILTALAFFGVTGITMWQLGCLLGFVSMFIRPIVSKREKS